VAEEDVSTIRGYSLGFVPRSGRGWPDRPEAAGRRVLEAQAAKPSWTSVCTYRPPPRCGWMVCGTETQG